MQTNYRPRAIKSSTLADIGIAIVKVSSAKMPSSCWGRYVHVALMIVDGTQGRRASMISTRARGVIRIVHVARKCHVGKTARAADEIAIKLATEAAREINTRSFQTLSRLALTEGESANKYYLDTTYPI